MKHMTKRLTIIISAFVLCCGISTAQNKASSDFTDGQMAISFDTGEGTQWYDGTSKAETYDAAIRLTDKSLIGKSIVGLRIPMESVDGIGEMSGWLSKELNLQTENGVSVNAPDIMTQDATPVEGWTEVNFDTPYVITEEGIYAGYSFKVSPLNSKNMKPLCLTTESDNDGAYLHTSRTSKYKQWTNMNEETAGYGSLCLQVIVTGMDANAATIEIYPDLNVQAGMEAEIPVTIRCHGYNGVSSIEYEYDFAGLNGTRSYTLENPIQPSYNKLANVNLSIPAVDEEGQYPIKIKITKVNGEPNTDSFPESESVLNVFDFVPVHRPLMEEYTGTWCGNCPRGIAGIEKMKEMYPDHFICISFHNNDPMEITTDFPSEIRGFPDAWIDRVYRADPFTGYGSSLEFKIDEVWEERYNQPATVGIDVTAEWADESEEVINVTTTIKSQRKYTDGQLTVAYALVADELTGPGWWQTNYYSGQKDCPPELEEIASQPDPITDIAYNDVVILTENIKGEEINLPDTIEPVTSYISECNMYLEDAMSTSGTTLIQDRNKLRIVAMIIDRTTSEIINANQSAYMVSNLSGIGECTDYHEKDIASVTYYDLSGMAVESPADGIFIKQVIYTDGTSTIGKVILQKE